jgi:threonine/homoserine/homoserine lactone efflux protein
MIDLLGLGLIITLEPLPLIGFILVLSTPRGRRNGLGFIAAWVLCLVAIIVATLSLTEGHPPATRSTPAAAAAFANLALGFVLLYIGWRVNRLPPDRPRKEPTWTKKIDQMSVWGASALGVLLQPWPLVAAAAATVVEAKISTTATVVVLVLFCLVATSSIATMEIYALASPEAARDRLDRLRAWLERHRDRGIVILSVSVGLWLAGKGIYLIVTRQA